MMLANIAAAFDTPAQRVIAGTWAVHAKGPEPSGWGTFLKMYTSSAGQSSRKYPAVRELSPPTAPSPWFIAPSSVASESSPLELAPPGRVKQCSLHRQCGRGCLASQPEECEPGSQVVPARAASDRGAEALAGDDDDVPLYHPPLRRPESQLVPMQIALPLSLLPFYARPVPVPAGKV
jgi:hypothetical protein